VVGPVTPGGIHHLFLDDPLILLAPHVADTDFTMLDTDNDGTIDANEFMAGCKGGLIKISQ